MKSWRNHWPALWILLILALVAAERIRLLSVPLERDEGEYAYAGQLMLEGEPPYKLVYNMKMPGIYTAYALIMSVFGQTTEGIRLGFMFVNFGAIVLIYFLGRRFLDRAGAIAASAIYALLSLSPYVQGINAHATHFVVLAALCAILALLRAQQSGRRAGFFWSGVLFGVAFLMKQPGGAFAFFGFTLLLWAAWRQQPRDWKMSGLRLALYAAGVAAPIVLTGLLLWRAGVWDKFWWWTVVYARVHATALSWSVGMARLGSYIKVVQWDWTFWVLALIGFVGLLMEKRDWDEKFFFSSFLIFSAGAILPTLNFTGHYFVLGLPVVALLSAKAATMAVGLLATQPLALVRVTPWILLGLLSARDAWSHRLVFFEWGPDEAAQKMYPSNDFQVYPVVADYLRTHTPPSATFAVLGSEPELPFYAHRRSVTGYIYMYDLVQPQPFRERMEKEMISEVEHGRPDYVIFVNLLFSWLPYPPKNLEGIQNWMEHYTQSQYVPYGVVTFPPNQYCFRPDCLNLIPAGKRFILIFQRKDLRTDDVKLPKSKL
jgi:4-amino-4-deoxy-L-arabinose transferase-like glycosyltransferase